MSSYPLKIRIEVVSDEKDMIPGVHLNNEVGRGDGRAVDKSGGDANG